MKQELREVEWRGLKQRSFPDLSTVLLALSLCGLGLCYDFWRHTRAPDHWGGLWGGANVSGNEAVGARAVAGPC